MVGRIVFGEKILIGLLMGGGSSWVVSPHSHQLEARLPWEGSSQATTYAKGLPRRTQSPFPPPLAFIEITNRVVLCHLSQRIDVIHGCNF
jgi:hypothetical protein